MNEVFKPRRTRVAILRSLDGLRVILRTTFRECNLALPDAEQTGARRAHLIDTSRKTQKILQRRLFLQGLGQDLRLSLRLIRIRPTFAGVVILTLALGIGVNSAIFSVLPAVVLTPLPYPESDRLVTVWTPQEGSDFNPLSSPDWMDYHEESESFEAWGAYQPKTMNLSGDGDPEQVRGISLSAGVLQALGTRPAKGRFFATEGTEDPPSRVAVVGDGLWKRRFGSDPGLVNSQILINQESYTVVGILPEGFQFPDWQSSWVPEVLIPICTVFCVNGLVIERVSVHHS